VIVGTCAENGEKRVLKLPQLLRAKRFWLIPLGIQAAGEDLTGRCDGVSLLERIHR
jgi:hypothetical protein